jgi:hypothetical protein
MTPDYQVLCLCCLAHVCLQRVHGCCRGLHIVRVPPGFHCDSMFGPKLVWLGGVGHWEVRPGGRRLVF